MNATSLAIAVPYDRIAVLCRRHGVSELAVYGSVLRDDFGPESTINALVEFIGGDAGPWMGRVFDLEADLARLFGRRVEVTTRGGVEPSRNATTRREVLDSARALYRHQADDPPSRHHDEPPLFAARLRLDPAELAAFCRRHHIRRLALFGSVLGDDFRPESDVDVLVEFEPGHTPGWEFFGMQDELSALFGRRVDLNTPGFLSRYFRDDVRAEALTLYESETQTDRHGSAPSHA